MSRIQIFLTLNPVVPNFCPLTNKEIENISDIKTFFKKYEDKKTILSFFTKSVNKSYSFIDEQILMACNDKNNDRRKKRVITRINNFLDKYSNKLNSYILIKDLLLVHRSILESNENVSKNLLDSLATEFNEICNLSPIVKYNILNSYKFIFFDINTLRDNITEAQRCYNKTFNKKHSIAINSIDSENYYYYYYKYKDNNFGYSQFYLKKILNESCFISPDIKEIENIDFTNNNIDNLAYFFDNKEKTNDSIEVIAILISNLLFSKKTNRDTQEIKGKLTTIFYEELSVGKRDTLEYALGINSNYIENLLETEPIISSDKYMINLEAPFASLDYDYFIKCVDNDFNNYILKFLTF